jgi:hypothetical protein
MQRYGTIAKRMIGGRAHDDLFGLSGRSAYRRGPLRRTVWPAVCPVGASTGCSAIHTL